MNSPRDIPAFVLARKAAIAAADANKPKLDAVEMPQDVQLVTLDAGSHRIEFTKNGIKVKKKA